MNKVNMQNIDYFLLLHFYLRPSSEKRQQMIKA